MKAVACVLKPNNHRLKTQQSQRYLQCLMIATYALALGLNDQKQ